MSAAVQPMHEAAIRQYAKQLRLPTLGSQFASLAEQAVKMCRRDRSGRSQGVVRQAFLGAPGASITGGRVC